MEPMQKGADIPISDPLIYQIKDREGKTCGYLFGTIHFADVTAKNLPNKVIKRLEKSKAAAVEIDLSKFNLNDILDKLKASLTNRLASLSSQQVDELLQSFKNCFSEIKEVEEKISFHEQVNKQLPARAVERRNRTLLAEFVGDFLHLCLLLGGNEISAKHGIDNHLIEFAKQLGKEVISLEDISDQEESRFSSNQPVKIDRETALATMKQVKEFLEAWKSGDKARLKKVAMAITPNEVVRSYKERNKKMADKIDNYLRTAGKEGRLFVAVGSSHIVLEGSIKELLEANGWTVKKVALRKPR